MLEACTWMERPGKQRSAGRWHSILSPLFRELSREACVGANVKLEKGPKKAYVQLVSCLSSVRAPGFVV